MNWLATVLVLGAVVTLTVLAVPALGSHPVDSSASDEAKTVARVTSIPEPSTASPSVAYTLDLCTNHLYSGNAFPIDCSGANPNALAYDSGKGEVFVANEGSNSVNVISDATNKVVATIPVGGFPEGVAYDSGKGEVFVANLFSNNVSVISDTSDTIISTVTVGIGSAFAIYDSSNGDVYVSNFYQGTISIITTGPAPSTYPVSFSQTGPPTGTNWSVTLNGQTLSSTISTVTFTEPNGTYIFTVGTVSGYTASPSSGSVTVRGSSQSVAITFTPFTYALTFTETGLPAGTSWAVTLDGSIKDSTTAMITFREPNGSYAFTVGSVSGYTANPSSSYAKVTGAAVSQSISFTSSNPTTGFLGLPGDDGDILIGVAAIILLAIAITVYVRRKRALPPAPGSTAQTNLPEKLPQPPPGHTWLLTQIRNKPKQ